jgi:hypothetical protein
MEGGKRKKNSSPLSLDQFVSITAPLLDLEKVLCVSMCEIELFNFSLLKYNALCCCDMCFGHKQTCDVRF